MKAVDISQKINKAAMRRQQIMEAAALCFKRDGFHGASMADIAKSFGMSAGHIYNYFDSKEAIIEAIVAQDCEQTLNRIEHLAKQTHVLQAMLDGVQQGIERRIARIGLDTEILAEASRNPKIAAAVRRTDSKTRAKLIELIDKLKPQASLTTSDIKTTVLLALFEGLMIRAIRDPSMNHAQLEGVLQNLLGQLFRL